MNSFQTTSPQRGWKLPGAHVAEAPLPAPFQTTSPQRGWKPDEGHAFTEDGNPSFQTTSPQRGWKLWSGLRRPLLVVHFPNHFPSTGMETHYYNDKGDKGQSTFQTTSPQRGWKPLPLSLVELELVAFQTTSPQRGWKPAFSPRRLSTIVDFPNHFPSTGMETGAFRYP